MIKAKEEKVASRPTFGEEMRRKMVVTIYSIMIVEDDKIHQTEV